jgi:copper homeostasis protein
MTIEICANSLASAMNAQKAGANRIELCAELSLGGVTPSPGTIQLARKHLAIDVFVLIRPRAGDFCYDQVEFEIIKADIEFCKSVGCDGVVIGVLNPDGSVDIERMKELIDLARPMEVTFQRSFDVCKNPLVALEQLIELGADRILTSGQKDKAIEGIDLLEQLVKQANGRIKIMPGSGVNIDNALAFQGIGAEELHFSASSLVDSLLEFHHPDVRLENAPYQITVSDLDKIEKVIQKLNGVKMQ